MAKYKLLALDMDGTVLNRNHEISEETFKWIHRAIQSGIVVMFATGREVQSINPYVEQLGLESPLVSVNGSEVWSAPGSLLVRHTLKDDWIKELQVLAEEKECRYWAYTVNHVYTSMDWTDQLERPEGDPWLKFGIHCDDPICLQEMHEILAATGRYELTNSSPRNIEINPHGINKASGIREICQLLDIQMDEVVACGDSLNDLEMIRAAGLGIAMGNAQEAVKMTANAVTATNEENGVAQLIQTYLVKELPSFKHS
ncbi:5-amino-6-(5-phospho-D-ribitylamino)uracil phosphatase YcsE [Bacillus sp. J14TS2]|uniref:Cof-type HAD-IIB family hydrolase n=1 Tax=Bacillus sp. J14TS2 TaxID=2807188 RepID=UPI001B0FFE24|nr:Cof-type HAD-IIB family hydrolase [Bacillus sp. J14TS2]GIN72093.1 5-amino-6-(5-phospho-D-ribitylamino)uracil phosphatase YcsE [Bacillus sp. J14TS2]